MDVHGGRVLRIMSGAVLAAALFSGLGCQDDNQGVDLNDQSPGDWTLLIPGQANDPAFGPAGSSAAEYVAFSSFRTSASVSGAPAAISEQQLGEHSHIWLQHEDGTEIQVTTGSGDDSDPAWSPSGTKICFTRDNGSRRDIWWADVSDPVHPGSAYRVTDRTIVLTNATDGDWVMVDGEEQIVFSDGADIFRISVTGGSPVKLIPDPGDLRPPECGGSRFNDLQPAPFPGGQRIAFISIGRQELGAIVVRTTDEAGMPTVANVWLQSCSEDSLTVEDSVATFDDLPLGDYRVRSYKSGVGFCDTLDIPVTLDAGSKNVDINFVPRWGTIMARSFSFNPSTFGYFIDCGYTDIISRPAIVTDPLQSLIFTPIPCVEEGVRMLAGTQASRVDTTWVNVVANEEVEVTLTFMDSSAVDSLDLPYVPYPRGGEGNFYTRRCPGDSICIEMDPSGACTKWDCTLPWGRDWILADTLCGPIEEPGLARGWGSWAPKAPAQDDEEIWTYDMTTSTFQKPLGSLVAQRPQWDPTGANRIAFLTRSGGFLGVQILNMDTGRITSIGLLGQEGPFVCHRDAISLSWAADGEKLAVAIGPCSGGQYPRDLQVYTVDLAELGL